MWSDFTTEDGTRLAFRDEGQGLPILALAGLTRDGTDFDYIADHLRDYRLIRLDARGRGRSDWAPWESYTVAQEMQDTLGLLDHLGLEKVALIGTSRGGIIGMMIAAMAAERLCGVCLVDVGPVLERKGLERIATYVGIEPDVENLEDAADRLPRAMVGFRNVPAHRWAEETVRHYHVQGDRVGLTYDPDLRYALAVAMAAPPVDLWPLFEACKSMPLALIHGVGSDVLSLATADDMQTRHPELIRADVPDRGHVPFLDEPASLACIDRWLAQISETYFWS